jgi:SAM-dependent methyltransferase
LAEFTGERVIPGAVDIDLFNEHMARYTFAARLARGKRVLDAGCGAGYGSAELAHTAAFVMGADVSADALAFAHDNYRLPNLAFEQASATALPHPDGAFDLVVAFEVIEHLESWRELLLESRRMLAPNGQFIVSTPNKLYYAESRGATGSNPFHVHEFEFEEFRSALKAVFPHVSLFLENHVEGVTFQSTEPGNTVEVRVDSGDCAPAECHFFMAVCAHRPQIGNPTFVYIPRSANVLRERERHIALLESEIATKNQWLDKAQQDLAEFDRVCRAQKSELERSNQWAEELNRELEERRTRVAELQQEIAREQEAARKSIEGYQAKVQDLERDIRDKTQWAIDTETRLTADIQRQVEELQRAVEALHRVESELEERTAWALRLKEDGQALEQRLAMFRASRWVKLGRRVGLGPAA